MNRCRLYIWPVWLLLGALLLTACQSDVLPDELKGGDKAAVCHTDSCYINLHIVNSRTAMTRATEAATAKENAVYDGILCIFEGDDESTATLRSAVVIDQLINNPGNSSSVNITQRLAGTHAYGEHLYVLALLNTTSTGFSIKDNTLYHHSTDLTNKTIDEIQTLRIDSVGSTDEHVGLFMSNAPQDGYIMPEVTDAYLYDTELAAAAGSRLTIDVERAAARVKVTNYVSTITSINLDRDPSRHPTVHRITWALHQYNTQSYAIRKDYTAAQNWATSVSGAGTLCAFDTNTPDIFDLFRQHSYTNGEAVYIAENTTDVSANQTQVIVEAQLKEGSFLLGDCYLYNQWGAVIIFFTSADKFIKYCKDGWKETFSPNFYAIKDKSAEEVFKYPSLVINGNGTVTVTLTNNSFTSAERAALVDLSNTLSGLLTGFRDGKIYYTYPIRHDATHEFGVVRNNAYNLKFTNVSAIGDPVPKPITQIGP